MRTEPLALSEPRWMSERDAMRDRADWEREQRLQRQEDEQPRASFSSTDTSGGSDA